MVLVCVSFVIVAGIPACCAAIGLYRLGCAFYRHADRVHATRRCERALADFRAQA